MKIRRSLTSTVSADEGVDHPLAGTAEKGRLRRKREPGDLPCGAIVLLLGGEDQTSAVDDGPFPSRKGPVLYLKSPRRWMI